MEGPASGRQRQSDRARQGSRLDVTYQQGGRTDTGRARTKRAGSHAHMRHMTASSVERTAPMCTGTSTGIPVCSTVFYPFLLPPLALGSQSGGRFIYRYTLPGAQNNFLSPWVISCPKLRGSTVQVRVPGTT